MSNFLSYSNLTFETIVQNIKDKVATDKRFDNFRESAIFQTLVEIFAGTTDLLNYYIERRAEECFLDTAKLTSSIYMLAKQMGYVIQRPIPAEAKIYLKLKGDFTSYNIVANDLLQIPIYTAFSFNNFNLILKNTFNYYFTSSDISAITTSAASFEKDIQVDSEGNYIYTIEGNKVSKIIYGNTNQQIGQTFQIYKIDDLTFSNRYGTEDFDIPITNIYVGTTKNDNTVYTIDRRSLLNWTYIENFIKGSPSKICVVRTANDGKIELLFGDAQYSALGATINTVGATTVYDNIYIDYLSTIGAGANITGIIGNKLTTNSKLLVNGDISKDITSLVEFYFLSNLVGGANIEDTDSIKINAPNIFYSLDRLVTARDYITYLKSLSSPIDIRNAIAWGEQEEIVNDSSNEPIQKLFNVVLFSCVGSLYDLNGSSYFAKSTENGLETSVLDLDYDENSIPYQNYFNLYIKEDVVKQLKEYETSGTNHIIYGNTVTSTVNDFKRYADQTELGISYNSDYFLVDTLGTIETSAISLSAISSYNDIAVQIKNTLLGVVDSRKSSSENTNYGNNLFDDLNVNWDTTNNRFVVSGGDVNSCFINYLYDPSSGVVTKAGLNNVVSQGIDYTVSNNTISDGIIKVVNDLNERSQVTIRNVYISPILQSIKLNGNIYFKQLSDKDSLHTTIKNAIYSWLDSNADFNVSINISNITEIIDSYSDVINSDIYFYPDYPIPPTGQTTFFDPAYDSRIEYDKYASEKTSIYAAIRSQICNYLGIAWSSVFEPYFTSAVWKIISLEYDIERKTGIISESFKNISERSFFNELMKKIYDELGSNSTFRDSQDFISVLSDMRKDLLYVIRYNMIDFNNNISQQYTTNIVNNSEIKTYLIGGFSLGSEIPKIIINTVAIYK